jgi:hypothetical protein
VDLVLPSRRPVHLEMSQQSAERVLVGRVVLPVSEVANVPVLKSYSPTSVAFENRIIQANGKEHILSTLDLLVENGIHFSLDPATLDGVFGENEQKLVMKMNGLFDTA